MRNLPIFDFNIINFWFSRFNLASVADPRPYHLFCCSITLLLILIGEHVSNIGGARIKWILLDQNVPFNAFLVKDVIIIAHGSVSFVLHFIDLAFLDQTLILTLVVEPLLVA